MVTYVTNTFNCWEVLNGKSASKTKIFHAKIMKGLMKIKNEYRTIKIPGVKQDMYAVSNFGSVKNIKSNHILNPTKNKRNGYLYISLMQDDNRPKKFYVHSLVAIHFIPIPKELKILNEKLVPNHLDFDKENNTVENLEWTTYYMNNLWNIEHDNVSWCEDAQNAKVTNDFVNDVCKLMESGYRNIQIFDILKIPRNRYYISLLIRIRTGKEWRKISEKYNIECRNTLRIYDDKYIERICMFLEKGYENKDMWKYFNITTKKDKEKFKKLVYAIKNRKTYKNISMKYIW